MAKEQSSLFRGALYALATAALLATQAPLSLLGAKRLSAAEFICVTEMVLLLCVPFMLRTQRSREHFRALISSVSNLGKFGVLLLIGLIGIVLYAFGLGRGHPIVISAVLNLDPFWAAIIAYLIAGKKIPTSLWTFTLCLAVAFVGAMLLAISQADTPSLSLEIFDSGSLLAAGLALPVPVLWALSGSLVGKWFADVDEFRLHCRDIHNGGRGRRSCHPRGRLRSVGLDDKNRHSACDRAPCGRNDPRHGIRSRPLPKSAHGDRQ